MTKQEVNDREYTRVKEELETIASQEVLGLVEQLELILEIRRLINDTEDYRRARDGE